MQFSIDVPLAFQRLADVGRVGCVDEVGAERVELADDDRVRAPQRFQVELFPVGHDGLALQHGVGRRGEQEQEQRRIGCAGTYRRRPPHCVDPKSETTTRERGSVIVGGWVVGVVVDC